jgi:leader peptidase (prepilin peptidase) / N-methyltransferase
MGLVTVNGDSASSESGHVAAGAAVPAVADAGGLLRPSTLAAGGVPAAVALAVLGLTSRGLVAAFFLGVLGVLSVIDYERHLLPNKIVLPAAAIVLLAQIAFFPDRALEWVLASVCTFSALLVVALIRPTGLGMGDVKLGLLLGAGLGAQVFAAVTIGFVAMWPVAVWLLVRDGRTAVKRAVPLGPALAFGAAVVTLAGGV